MENFHPAHLGYVGSDQTGPGDYQRYMLTNQHASQHDGVFRYPAQKEAHIASSQHKMQVPGGHNFPAMAPVPVYPNPPQPAPSHQKQSAPVYNGQEQFSRLQPTSSPLQQAPAYGQSSPFGQTYAYQNCTPPLPVSQENMWMNAAQRSPQLSPAGMAQNAYSPSIAVSYSPTSQASAPGLFHYPSTGSFVASQGNTFMPDAQFAQNRQPSPQQRMPNPQVSKNRTSQQVANRSMPSPGMAHHSMSSSHMAHQSMPTSIPTQNSFQAPPTSSYDRNVVRVNLSKTQPPTIAQQDPQQEFINRYLGLFSSTSTQATMSVQHRAAVAVSGRSQLSSAFSTLTASGRMPAPSHIPASGGGYSGRAQQGSKVEQMPKERHQQSSKGKPSSQAGQMTAVTNHHPHQPSMAAPGWDQFQRRQSHPPPAHMAQKVSGDTHAPRTQQRVQATFGQNSAPGVLDTMLRAAQDVERTQANRVAVPSGMYSMFRLNGQSARGRSRARGGTVRGRVAATVGRGRGMVNPGPMENVTPLQWYRQPDMNQASHYQSDVEAMRGSTASAVRLDNTQATSQSQQHDSRNRQQASSNQTSSNTGGVQSVPQSHTSKAAALAAIEIKQEMVENMSRAKSGSDKDCVRKNCSHSHQADTSVGAASTPPAVRRSSDQQVINSNTSNQGNNTSNKSHQGTVSRNILHQQTVNRNSPHQHIVNRNLPQQQTVNRNIPHEQTVSSSAVQQQAASSQRNLHNTSRDETNGRQIPHPSIVKQERFEQESDSHQAHISRPVSSAQGALPAASSAVNRGLPPQAAARSNVGASPAVGGAGANWSSGAPPVPGGPPQRQANPGTNVPLSRNQPTQQANPPAVDVKPTISAREKAFNMWRLGQVVGRDPAKCRGRGKVTAEGQPASRDTVPVPQVRKPNVPSRTLPLGQGTTDRGGNINSQNRNSVPAKAKESVVENSVAQKPGKSYFYATLHGHKLLCLQSGDRPFVLVCQFQFQCFSDVGVGSVTNCIDRALRIKKRLLDHPDKSKILLYLKNNGYLQGPGAENFVYTISVDDARRVYHYMYNIQGCSSEACLMELTSVPVDFNAVLPAVMKRELLMKIKKEKAEDKSYGRLPFTSQQRNTKNQNTTVAHSRVERLDKSQTNKENAGMTSEASRNESSDATDEYGNDDSMANTSAESAGGLPEPPGDRNLICWRNTEAKVGGLLNTVVGQVRSYQHKRENYLVVDDVSRILGMDEFYKVVKIENISLFSCCEEIRSFLNGISLLFPPISSMEKCLVKEKDIGTESTGEAYLPESDAASSCGSSERKRTLFKQEASDDFGSSPAKQAKHGENMQPNSGDAFHPVERGTWEDGSRQTGSNGSFLDSENNSAMVPPASCAPSAAATSVVTPSTCRDSDSDLESSGEGRLHIVFDKSPSSSERGSDKEFCSPIKSTTDRVILSSLHSQKNWDSLPTFSKKTSHSSAALKVQRSESLDQDSVKSSADSSRFSNPEHMSRQEITSLGADRTENLDSSSVASSSLSQKHIEKTESKSVVRDNFLFDKDEDTPMNSVSPNPSSPEVIFVSEDFKSSSTMVLPKVEPQEDDSHQSPDKQDSNVQTVRGAALLANSSAREDIQFDTQEAITSTPVRGLGNSSSDTVERSSATQSKIISVDSRSSSLASFISPSIPAEMVHEQIPDNFLSPWQVGPPSVRSPEEQQDSSRGVKQVKENSIVPSGQQSHFLQHSDQESPLAPLPPPPSSSPASGQSQSSQGSSSSQRLTTQHPPGRDGPGLAADNRSLVLTDGFRVDVVMKKEADEDVQCMGEQWSSSISHTPAVEASDDTARDVRRLRSQDDINVTRRPPCTELSSQKAVIEENSALKLENGSLTEMLKQLQSELSKAKEEVKSLKHIKTYYEGVISDITSSFKNGDEETAIVIDDDD